MKIKIDFDIGDQFLTLEEFRDRTEGAYLRLLIGRFPTRALTAAALGISRKNLWERARRLGLTDLDPPTPNLTVTEPVSIAA